MTGMTSAIVVLWLLPVILCIAIPLAILGSWLVGRYFLAPMRRIMKVQRNDSYAN